MVCSFVLTSYLHLGWERIEPQDYVIELRQPIRKLRGRDSTFFSSHWVINADDKVRRRAKESVGEWLMGVARELLY